MGIHSSQERKIYNWEKFPNRSISSGPYVRKKIAAIIIIFLCLFTVEIWKFQFSYQFAYTTGQT